MRPWHKRIQIFTNKYPLIGPTFWMLSLQYYIIQLVVAAAWTTPFSLRNNPISDLGNTACGEYSMRYVCSPLHPLMNASFIALGLLMIAGSTLIYEEFRKNAGTAIAFTLMGIAGFGTILVGLFPENTIIELHFLGAVLPFVLGNIALVLFGFVLGLSGWFRAYTLLSGILAVVALALFYTENYLGLGQGGMERIVAYPQSLWLIFFGIYMSKNRFKATAHRFRQKMRSRT